MEKSSSEHEAEFLTRLKERFEENPALHKGFKWKDIEKRLDDQALDTRRTIAADQKCVVLTTDFNALYK